MADIEFHEDEGLARRAAPVRKRSSLTDRVIKAGFAKDEKGANMVLVIVSVGAIIAALSLFLFMNRSTPAPRIPVDVTGVPAR